MHPSLPVPGYTPQGDDKIAIVSANKELEETVLRVIDQIGERGAGDPRWLAVARTQIEQGFMALNRAVFQPRRIALPADGDSHG